MEKHTYNTIKFTIVLKKDKRGWGTIAVFPKDRRREARFFRLRPRAIRNGGK